MAHKLVLVLFNITGNASLFIGVVKAIVKSIAYMDIQDALTTGASVLVFMTLAIFTVLLIATIVAVVIAVTLPITSDASAVLALKLRFCTVSVSACTHLFILIRSVTAVIIEIAQPFPKINMENMIIHPKMTRRCKDLLWYALFTIPAFPFILTGTLVTVLREFVRVVTAVILAITKQPFWNASVTVMARTTFPTKSAVLVLADVSWLITVITAVIFVVTAPKEGNALTIGASEL